MKKVVVSFLAGAVFATSATVFADNVKSLVGRKVQAKADVMLNGQKIDTAIAIDGKSYAPVRSIAEAAGLNVSYRNGRINLDTVRDVPGYSAPQTPSMSKERIEKRLQEARERFRYYEDTIKRLETDGGIERARKAVEIAVSEPEKYSADEVELFKRRVERAEKELADAYKYKAELEALITELEAQLAALESE
mgnify:CR=1 FL=1|jgi:Zn-ribbon protein, possibly nucleic acid-binding